MHLGSIDESQGKFSNDWEFLPVPVPCRHCGVSGQVVYRNWESDCSSYDDAKFHCRACEKTWWVEGIDS
jgi:hypothetical protein